MARHAKMPESAGRIANAGKGRAMRFAGTLLAILLFVSPAWAASEEDRTECARPGNPDQAIAACTRIIESQQGSKNVLASIYGMRANLHQAKGNLDRAIADYGQAIRLMEEAAPASWELAFFYWLSGHVYRGKGDLDRAIASYDESIRVAPRWDKAYNDRGAIYFQKGDYERALADLGKVIEIKPNDATSYSLRAMVYSKMGEPAKGLPDADRAVQMKSKDAFARQMRGNVFEALGRKNEAIADYQSALKLNQAMSESREALKRLGVEPAAEELPDLILRDLHVRRQGQPRASGNQVKRGQPYLACFVVANRGNAASGEFRVQGGGLGIKTNPYQDHAGLKPEESRAGCLQYATTPAPGTHRLGLTVDALKAVQESDENNNSGVVTVVVVP